MLNKELEKLVLKEFKKIKHGLGHKVGSGYARKVYKLNKNIVLKVEPILGFIPYRLGRYARLKLVDERNYLIKELQNNKIKKFPNVYATELYLKFLDMTGLTNDMASIDIYMAFKAHDCHSQNIPDYINALIIEKTELAKYVPKNLGLLFIDGYTIVVQEKLKPIKYSNAINQIKIDIVKSFQEKGYNLLDVKFENIMQDKEGNIKICDLGVSNFTGEKHYCEFD